MPENLTPFAQLQEAIFLAIIQLSVPQGQVITSEGTRGAEVGHDPVDVLAALNWVAATFVVQSGDYQTRADRKRFAKGWGDQLLEMCGHVEEALKNHGEVRPFNPS